MTSATSDYKLRDCENHRRRLIKKKKNKKGRKTSIIFHEINYFPLCLPRIKTISSISSYFWNTLKILFINSIRFNFYIKKKKKSEIGSNLFFLKRERKKIIKIHCRKIIKRSLTEKSVRFSVLHVPASSTKTKQRVGIIKSLDRVERGGGMRYHRELSWKADREWPVEKNVGHLRWPP